MSKMVRMPLDTLVPDPNNPRREFGDLAALAATFEGNVEHPGEPLNAIVAVRDGNKARIFDGERRWRAMKLAGAVSECNVCLYDRVDEAAAAAAMVATDDKLPLSPEELSRGVQHMLALGLDDATIDRDARRTCAAGVRRALTVTGAERAETMSLDWLLAVDELERSGNHEAAEKVAAADGAKWQAAAERERMAALQRKRADEVADVLREAGFRELADGEVPERGDSAWKWCYLHSAKHAANVLATGGERTWLGFHVSTTTYGFDVTAWYEPAEGEGAEDVEKANRAAQEREDVEAFKRKVEAVSREHFTWFGGLYTRIAATAGADAGKRALLRALEDEFRDEAWQNDLDEFAEKSGTDAIHDFDDPDDIAVAFTRWHAGEDEAVRLSPFSWQWLFGEDAPTGWTRARWAVVRECWDTLADAGYEPGELEREVRGVLDAAEARAEAEDAARAEMRAEEGE